MNLIWLGGVYVNISFVLVLLFLFFIIEGKYGNGFFLLLIYDELGFLEFCIIVDIIIFDFIIIVNW